MSKTKIYQLRIIKQGDEKPSLLSRISKHTSVEGCFLPLLLIGYIVHGLRKLFGSTVRDKNFETVSFGDKSLYFKLDKGDKEIEYSKMKDLKLYFNSDSYIEDSDYAKFSKIKFEG